MMYWFGTDVSGLRYTLMIVSMAAFWGLVVTGFMLLTRSGDRAGPASEDLLVRPR